MGDNPFDEPATNTSQRLLNTGGGGGGGGARSYGGSGGYTQREVFGDSYVGEEPRQAEYKPELQFQNFQHTTAATPAKAGTINSGGAIIQPDQSVVDFGEEGHQPLTGGPSAGPGDAPPPVAPEPTNAKFWTIQYYRPLFNVDTTQVVQRILRSVMPFRFGFIETAKANPDFYGPFWIATSLVFILAIAGNLYSYFKYYFETPNGKDSTQWNYNFNVIMVGACVFYGYTVVIPFVLWGALKYLNVPVRPLEILCIYGYSMFIYIPISIICVIPISLLQWVLTLFACVWSGVFLISNLMAVIKDFAFKRGLIAMAIVGGLHVALALTYKFYFFEHAYKRQ